MAAEEPNQPFQRISYKSEDAVANIALHLQNDGVVVIEDVFKPEECTEFCDEIARCFQRLCPKVIPTPAGAKTWIPSNLPPGPRSGLFQGLVANFPPVWDIRTHPRVRDIFTRAYSGLRDTEVTDFFSSMDGINVRPHTAPFHEETEGGPYVDWAHLDQTHRNDTYWCIQGQVVLSDSTACFRCSPKSHLVYGDLLDKAGNEKNTGWCKFTKTQIPEIRKTIEDAGGSWQLPIRSKRGSVILWLSSTVHSAMTQTKERVRLEEGQGDKWKDWRFVVYTCYRPKNECDNKHADRLKQALRENRCTNHSGVKIFPVARGNNKIQYEAKMDKMVHNPREMYRIMPLLETKEVKKLTRY
jgi:hypothetical protein